nr:hypothetical protein [Tanacetum cinerariifolium]
KDHKIHCALTPIKHQSVQDLYKESTNLMVDNLKISWNLFIYSRLIESRIATCFRKQRFCPSLERVLKSM